MENEIRNWLDFPVIEITLELTSAIGLASCPGKLELTSSGRRGFFRRDLEADVDAIRAWRAGLVLTLLPDEELAELGVHGIGAAVVSRGMSWLHLPIDDGSAPSPQWEEAWSAVRAQVHGELDSGGRVLLHCELGRGRSGLVAARILIERGSSAPLAIAHVRAHRPGAIETVQQADYLMNSKAASWAN